MKWFREIDLKVEMEVDFSEYDTDYQNDIFSGMASELQTNSDVDISVIPPVFSNSQYTNSSNSEILMIGDAKIGESMMNTIENFEVLQDFKSCTSCSMNLNSVYKNIDKEFEF